MSAHIVIKGSVKKVILKNMNTFTLEKSRMFVHFVAMRAVKKVVL